MPVTIEDISQPSLQDLEDLQKIFEDAPSWMLEEWQSSNHRQAVEQLLESISQSSHRHLFAARFNSRLLGAMIVDQEQSYWLLHRLCVRKLTRNRGVGGRLIEQVASKARLAGKQIKLHDPEKQLKHELLQQTLGDYQRLINI